MLNNPSNNNLINGNVVIWYYVKNLNRSVEWYSDILGIAPTDNIDVAYFFSINEKTKLAISDRFKANKENELPLSVTLDLQTDDILEAHRILTEKGAIVEKLENPIESYYEFYFRDLDDNLIRMHGFVE